MPGIANSGVQRAALVRRYIEEQGLQVDEAPEDEDVRQTHNFAPGSMGLVYRADTARDGDVAEDSHQVGAQDDLASPAPAGAPESNGTESDAGGKNQRRYVLQSMKWGLIPFWTKRQPDYGSMMKTINCRDDSLAENRGMWTSMKKKKRCIVVCQGFYEWLKKSGGQKVPHFVKRKDAQLMLMAGLYDSVTYEGRPHLLTSLY